MFSAVQCRYWCEERIEGKRYVTSRWQCGNRTRHKTEYCHMHRWCVNGYDAFGKKIGQDED